MDKFMVENPGCGWRAVAAAIEWAMMKSMKEGAI
jgi:hypothetical protein